MCGDPTPEDEDVEDFFDLLIEEALKPPPPAPVEPEEPDDNENTGD